MDSARRLLRIEKTLYLIAGRFEMGRTFQTKVVFAMSTKAAKIVFWITTSLIFLFEGVMPALTSQTEMAKEGIAHLGYPAYFGAMLVVFKVLGAITLIIPQIPARVKEWAYAGFAIDFIAAFVSHAAVDGLGFDSFFPLIVFAVLIASYLTYHKVWGMDKKPESAEKSLFG
jgi:DoxX-like family